MKHLFAPLVLLWRIWFALVATIGVIIVAIPLFVCIQKEKYYPTTWQIMRFWGYFVFYGVGMRYRINKKINIQPNQAHIFISNHTSLMDIPLMLILCAKHPAVFVGKAELAKYPIFGKLYSRTNIVVNRSSQSSRMLVFREAQKKINLGRSIIIFPEGGVPDDESIRLDRFKDGAFAIAIANQLPIVVCTFVGLKQAFPYSYFRGRPKNINVFLEDVIPTNNKTTKDLNEVKQLAFGLIDNRLKQAEG